MAFEFARRIINTLGPAGLLWEADWLSVAFGESPAGKDACDPRINAHTSIK
jgi:hypothetical protein